MLRLAFAAAFGFFVAFVPQMAKAQPAVEAAVLYGSEIEKPGARLGLYYMFPGMQGLRAGVDGSVFWPESTEVINADTTTWLFTGNANLQYALALQRDFDVYALAGLNVAYVHNSIDVTINGETTSDSDGDVEFGVNLGGGAEYNVGFGNVFGEAKYVISDFDQLVLAVGLRFFLGQPPQPAEPPMEEM